MKTLILVVLLVFVLVPVAYAAQDAPPDSADLVNAVTALIAAVGALVANFVITLLKTIPFLGDEDKDKLAQATTEVVSVVVGFVTGWIVALIGQWIGLVGDSNLQVTVIAALTPIFNELRYRVAKLSPSE